MPVLFPPSLRPFFYLLCLYFNVAQGTPLRSGFLPTRSCCDSFPFYGVFFCLSNFVLRFFEVSVSPCLFAPPTPFTLIPRLQFSFAFVVRDDPIFFRGSPLSNLNPADQILPVALNLDEIFVLYAFIFWDFGFLRVASGYPLLETCCGHCVGCACLPSRLYLLIPFSPLPPFFFVFERL